MSVDKLQDKIRKLKNPTVLDLFVTKEQIPPKVLEAENSVLSARERYSLELLENLEGIVPAVRLDYTGFALQGTQGLAALKHLCDAASANDYYVLLEVGQALGGENAVYYADLLFSERMEIAFDGLIIGSYIGSDGIRPYAQLAQQKGKSVFVAVRTANRSASELQDLLTGSRLVHAAAADIVNRLSEGKVGKSGYLPLGAMASATSAESLRNLRSKYNYLFLLADGYDSPSANAKNCSAAFDRLGHGAAVCAGASITAAWREDGEEDYISCAKLAADRMKKNLLRYITIL